MHGIILQGHRSNLVSAQLKSGLLITRNDAPASFALHMSNWSGLPDIHCRLAVSQVLYSPKALVQMQRFHSLRSGTFTRLHGSRAASALSCASHRPRLHASRLGNRAKIRGNTRSFESKERGWPSLLLAIAACALSTETAKYLGTIAGTPLHPPQRDDLRYEHLPPDTLSYEFFPLPRLEGPERCRKHREQHCAHPCCNLPTGEHRSRKGRCLLEYEYLPDGYIRLIKIKPGLPESKLELMVFPIRFIPYNATPLEASFPEYTAMSYMWGDDKDIIDVDCGGVVTPLRRNIHSLLCECRNRGEYGPFWFDTLSIDQNDEEEKGRQIKIMHDIYKYSARLIVWLGDDDGSVDMNAAIEIIRAFKANDRQPLRNVKRKLREITQWRRTWKGMERRKVETLSSMEQAAQADLRNEDELRQAFKLTREHDSGWSAVKNLLQRPYFQRAWIVQEIALAGNLDRSIWIGKQDVSDLFTVVSILMDHPQIEGLLHEDVLTTPETLPRLYSLLRASRNYRHGTKSSSWSTWLFAGPDWHWHGYWLGMLLSEYRGKQCKEPEDQVRSMRGLTSLLTSPPVTLPHLFLQKLLAPQPSMLKPADTDGTPDAIQDRRAKIAFFEAARDIISTEKNLEILAHHNLYFPKDDPAWPSWLPDWNAPRPEMDSPRRTITNQDTFPWYRKRFRFRKDVLFINAHVLGQVGRKHKTLSLQDALADAADVEARSQGQDYKPPASEREALRMYQTRWSHRFLPGPVYESAIGELQGPSNMREGDIIVVAAKCPEPLLLRAHEDAKQEMVYKVIGTCYIPSLRESSEFWKGIEWKIEEMEIR